MSSDIVITNVRRGAAPLIISCDLLVGDVKIYGVTLRRGRANTTYVNLPKLWQNGHWQQIVEITSADLLDAVRHAVVMAACEQTRYALSG